MSENDGGYDYVEKIPMILNGGTFLSSSSPISWHSTKCEPCETWRSMISSLRCCQHLTTLRCQGGAHVGCESPICAAFSITTAPL